MIRFIILSVAEFNATESGKKLQQALWSAGMQFLKQLK